MKREEIVSVIGIVLILTVLAFGLANGLIGFGDVRSAATYALVAGIVGFVVFGFRHRLETPILPPPPPPPRKPVIEPPLEYQTQAISLLLGNWINWKHTREMTLMDLAKLLPILSLRDGINPAFEPLTLESVKEGLEHLVKAGTIKEIRDGMIRF